MTPEEAKEAVEEMLDTPNVDPFFYCPRKRGNISPERCKEFHDYEKCEAIKCRNAEYISASIAHIRHQARSTVGERRWAREEYKKREARALEIIGEQTFIDAGTLSRIFNSGLEPGEKDMSLKAAADLLHRLGKGRKIKKVGRGRYVGI